MIIQIYSSQGIKNNVVIDCGFLEFFYFFLDYFYYGFISNLDIKKQFLDIDKVFINNYFYNLKYCWFNCIQVLVGVCLVVLWLVLGLINQILFLK